MKSQFMSWLFAGIGVLFAGLGIPLILEKVGPNSAYGFRTAKTMSSPEIWYPINKIMGYDLLIAGCVILITALILLKKGKEMSIAKVATINLVVLLVALGAAVAHGFFKLSNM